MKDRLPALDGLRGIAIIAVMCHHFVAPKMVGWAWWFYRALYLGWWGVDLFFVLSGFLITGILLDVKQKGGSLFNFYMRRTLRIFPLHYGTLIVMFSLYALSPKTMYPMIDIAGENQWWWWLYASNVFIALQNTWVGGCVAQFWTLAIEEHFYLAWPLAVLLLSRRRLMVLSMVLMVVAFFARMWFYNRTLIPGCYVFTLCRMDGLCAGAWLACAFRESRDLAALMRMMKWIGGAAAMCLAYLLYEHGFQLDLLLRSAGLGGITAIALLCVSVVAHGASPGQSWFKRALSVGWLRFFGKYSYGIYVIHPIVMHFTGESMSIYKMQRWCGYGMASLIYFTVAIGLSVVAAIASYHLFEKHFLRLKRFFPSTKPVYTNTMVTGVTKDKSMSAVEVFG